MTHLLSKPLIVGGSFEVQTHWTRLICQHRCNTREDCHNTCDIPIGQVFGWKWNNVFTSNWISFQFHSLGYVNHQRNYTDQKPVPNHKIWLHCDWKLNENLPQLNWKAPGRPFHFVPLAMRTNTCFHHLLPIPFSIALSPILSLLLLLYMPQCFIMPRERFEGR